MIPGLERAEFVRLGSLHRNVFLPEPPPEAKVKKDQRRAWQLARAAEALAGWLREVAPAADAAAAGGS